MTDQVAAHCYRHPDRETRIGCQRCSRPICPECMTPAAVGFQCPACVAEGARSTRTGWGPYGGRRAENPQVTSIALITVNVLIWLVVFLTGREFSPLVSALALLPKSRCDRLGTDTYYPGASQDACTALGSGVDWVDGVAAGAWWQLLSNAFVHVDPIHILSNVISLWFLGPPLEQVMGRVRFLVVYVVSVLTSSAAVMWLSDPEQSTLGASGAIFGVLGALLVVARRARANVQLILLILGLNVFTTVIGGPSISWQGHLGGFLGGALVALLITNAPRDRRWLVWPVLAGLALATVGLIVIRAVQLA